MPTGGDGDCTMWKTSIRGGWWLTSAPKHVRHATRTLESGEDKSADDNHNHNDNNKNGRVLLTKTMVTQHKLQHKISSLPQPPQKGNRQLSVSCTVHSIFM